MIRHRLYRPSTRRPRRKLSHRRRPARFEPLEERRLLATDVLAQIPIGTTGDSVREIQLEFSAPLTGDSARDQANFRLTHLGDDQQLGGGDDQVVAVLPQYYDGSTQLRVSTLTDLAPWGEIDYGFPNGILGDWQNQSQTGGVTQVANGGATFFVSDTTTNFGQFATQFQVAATTDDDALGVVFGFSEDPSTGLPDAYYLLSWKRATEGSASSGLKLAKVEGT
ncbi:MAG: hypothetical protein ACC628_27850, partial [Pirellulaceae bacterium]